MKWLIVDTSRNPLHIEHLCLKITQGENFYINLDLVIAIKHSKDMLSIKMNNGDAYIVENPDDFLISQIFSN